MWILEHREWMWLVDLGATLSALALFLTAGLALRRVAAARGRSRPISAPLGRRLMRSLRPARLRQFESMANDVLRDVGSVIVDGPHRHSEARALLPMVAEVRRYGEGLQKGRPRLSKVLWPLREARLAPLVRDLGRVEGLLRELPRSRLTLEDVLAGRFEEGNVDLKSRGESC